MLDPNRPPPPTRETFCRIVQQEIGKPEPERIRDYHTSAIGGLWVGPFAQWCGLFCLWGLHESGIATAVKWKLGGGFCEEQGLDRVKLPEPGDIAYYDRPFQHHAVVISVDTETGTFTSCDGNQANDTVVLRTKIQLTKATHFYSIAKLLQLDTKPAPPPGGEDGNA